MTYASFLNSINDSILVDFVNRLDKGNYKFLIIVQIILMHSMRSYLIIDLMNDHI